jgi:hypothetical protein
MFVRGAQIPCWSTRTTEETERVVLAHGVPQPNEAGPLPRCSRAAPRLRLLMRAAAR